jgi:hypothetical protein
VTSDSDEFELYKKYVASKNNSSSNQSNPVQNNPIQVSTQQLEPANGKTEIQYVTSGTKSKTLYVHLVANKNQEIAIVKKKTFDQDFDYDKRTYIIKPNMFITDKDGVEHFYCDINDTYGGLSFYKDHIDNCNKCGKTLSKDSQTSYVLTRKRNAMGIWGVDSQHTILLLVSMVVALILGVGLFYVIGDDNTTHKTLESFLPKSPSTGHFIIGGIILNESIK